MHVFSLYGKIRCTQNAGPCHQTSDLFSANASLWAATLAVIVHLVSIIHRFIFPSEPKWIWWFLFYLSHSPSFISSTDMTPTPLHYFPICKGLFVLPKYTIFSVNARWLCCERAREDRCWSLIQGFDLLTLQFCARFIPNVCLVSFDNRNRFNAHSLPWAFKTCCTN